MKRFLSACARGAFYVLLLIGAQYLTQTIYLVLYFAGEGPPSFADLNTLFVEQSAPILLIADLTVICLYLLTAPMRRKSICVHLSLYPLDRRAVLPLILLGLCTNFVVSLLLGVLPFPASWWETYEASASMLSVEFSLAAVLAQAFIGPIAEEFCFRGLLYTRLRCVMPKIIAALVSALIFGVVHGTAIWFFYAFLLGFVMVWLFQRFESLWASILFHISFNGINFLLVLLPQSIYVPLCVICCVGFVACMVWLLRITRREATCL